MAIRKVVDKGIPVYFMHGNRDFMIGRQFANETGVEILKDPHPCTMYGQKTLLSHGDAMCIDDVKYQKVREMTRNPFATDRIPGGSRKYEKGGAFSPISPINEREQFHRERRKNPLAGDLPDLPAMPESPGLPPINRGAVRSPA